MHSSLLCAGSYSHGMCLLVSCSVVYNYSHIPLMSLLHVHADKIVGNSFYTRKCLIFKHHGDDKLSLLPNPVSTDTGHRNEYLKSDNAFVQQARSTNYIWDSGTGILPIIE